MRNFQLLRFCTFAFGFAVLIAIVLGGCTGSPVVCDGFKVDAVSPKPDASPVSTSMGVNNPVLTLDEAIARVSAADDWKTHPPLDLPRHPAEKYLEGWVIVLDPGHGGKSLEVDGWKMGPNGVREAEMNLRVGLMLREMLERAGATVGMTRTEETSDIADDRIGEYNHNAAAPGSSPDAPKEKTTLQLRAEYASNFERPEGTRPGGIPDEKGVLRGADLFISIHHNASSSPESNYTTVWFHGPAEDATVELDAARHLAREIGQALRTDVGKTSPIMNDRQMYESGFGVLRNATVPAVLTESSFYTNPDEELRLSNPGYLIREAYAMYTALCELAYSGRPTQTTPEFVIDAATGSPSFSTVLSDGQPAWWGHDLGRVLPSSVTLQFDDSPSFLVSSRLTPRDTEPRTESLVLEGDIGNPGLDDDPQWRKSAITSHEDGSRTASFTFTIKHQNFLKAHNWPQRYAVELKWEPGADLPEVVAVRPLGAKRDTE